MKGKIIIQTDKSVENVAMLKGLRATVTNQTRLQEETKCKSTLNPGNAYYLYTKK
jgi:hypothetical protein